VKSDLDRLMADRGFDAIVVMGEAEANHTLKYLTNHARITQGIVVKKRGEDPVLIVGGMERDEAAKSGLAVRTMAEFNLYQHIKEAGGVFEGNLRMLAEVFKTLNISGVVSFYGIDDPGTAYMRLKRLDEMLDEITVTGETGNTLFDEAYATKDAAELDAIKRVAEHTNQVMAETVDFIRGHRVQDGALVDEEGQPLTVGAVKRYVDMRLLFYGLEDSGEKIFAINQDAGVPHSRGEAEDELKLGDCIVFDLFPRSIETGYFHDMTRTFCLGRARPDVQHAYNQVMQAFTVVMDSLEVGKETSTYQNLVCDIFEEHGHKTVRNDPGTEEGYVHSLGHGIGLQIHSNPRFSTYSDETVQPGQVFTIEPGLYYPDQGYGVRIEDSVYVAADGTIHSLTPYSKNLIIPFE
jgi:Xaa-Pro aminopeptidase